MWFCHFPFYLFQWWKWQFLTSGLIHWKLRYYEREKSSQVPEGYHCNVLNGLEIFQNHLGRGFQLAAPRISIHIQICVFKHSPHIPNSPFSRPLFFPLVFVSFTNGSTGGWERTVNNLIQNFAQIDFHCENKQSKDTTKTRLIFQSLTGYYSNFPSREYFGLYVRLIRHRTAISLSR